MLLHMVTKHTQVRGGSEKSFYAPPEKAWKPLCFHSAHPKAKKKISRRKSALPPPPNNVPYILRNLQPPPTKLDSPNSLIKGKQLH